MSTPVPALEFSSVADAYESTLVGPIFRPWAELLVERLHLGATDALLDIACGTGIVARVARERMPGGRVTGVDANVQMLGVARAIAPDIDWREGNAAALPVDNSEAFDVITCQQGLQFFPDRSLAAREFRRVIAPGGRLAVATWRSLDEHPFFVELGRIAERHVGPVVDARHAFGDERALQALLAGAGFADIHIEVNALVARFPEWSIFVRMNAMALVGMSAASKQLSPEERARIIASIVQESEGVARSHVKGSELTFELRSNVAVARS